MARRTCARTMLVAAALLAGACTLAACGGQEDKPAPAAAPAGALSVPPSPSQKAEPPASATPAAAVPPVTPAAIGKVDALDGTVTFTRGGRERPAQAGMAMEERDTYTAGQESWALLAMTDGASITLRPGSQVRFDSYRYAAAGPAAANTAAMSLVKGALRSITGLVGKTNPAGYQVKTPSATIGIRGTDHEPAYYPPPAPGEKAEHPPGTYDKVNSGQSIIQSRGGSLPVRPGQTAFAHFDAKAKPQVLARPPVFYQRQAEIDRRVALRRAQFHREFDQERQKEAQAIRIQQQEAAKKAQDERRAKQQEARRLDLDARKAQQDKRKGEPQKKKDESKGAPAKGGKADERKGKDDRKQARDDRKAALPPAVADRVRNMQRGDKAASGNAAGTAAQRRDVRPERGTPVGGGQQPQRPQGVAQQQRPTSLPQEKAQRQAPAPPTRETRPQREQLAPQPPQGRAQAPNAPQRSRNEREPRKGAPNETPAR